MFGALLALLIGCGRTSSATTPTGSNAATTVKLGAQTFNDHGMMSVQGKEQVGIEADNFYFAPTFLQGAPGQQLTLAIANDSSTTHNISIDATPAITMDIPAHGKVTVTATVPASGVILFYCKYHTGMGMNGELLAAPATPQPASQDKPTPATGYHYP